MSTSDQPRKDELTQPKEQPAPKKKRRWLKILIAVAVLLLLLVAAAPWLLSLGIARSIAESQANGALKGSFTVGEVNLSWFGENSVAGFTATDLDGRKVLDLEKVTYSPGLLSAVGSPYSIGTVTVGRTDVTLYLDEDGRPSIAEAFESKKPTVEKEPADLPPLKGAVIYGPINVKVVRHDGRTITQAVNGNITFDTLARIVGKQTTVFGNGGTLVTEYTINDAVTDGVATPMQAEVDLSMKSPEAIDAGTLLAFFSGVDQVQGRATLDTQIAVADGTVKATLDNVVTGLRQKLPDGSWPEAVDLTFKGNVSGDRERSSGQLTFGGSLGEIVTTINITLPEKTLDLTTEKLTAALLDGSPSGLPAMTVVTDGSLDVARLARSIPQLLNLRKDVTLEQGQLVVRQARLDGGTHPKAAGEVLLEGFRAVRNGQPLDLKPTKLNWDVAIVPGTGLKITSTTFDTAGLLFEAEGTLKSLDASLNAQIETLTGELAKVFEMGDTAASGTVASTFTLRRPEDNRIVFNQQTRLRNIAASGVGEGVLLRDTRLDADGTLHLDGNTPTRIELTQSVLNVDDLVKLTSSGKADFTKKTASGKAEMPVTPFEKLAVLAARFGVKDLQQYGGTVDLAASGKADWSASLTGNYDVVSHVRNFTVGGKPKGGDDVDLTSEGSLQTAQPDRLLAKGESRVQVIRSARGLPTGRDGDWTFIYDLALDQGADTLQVNVFKLNTDPLKLETTGKVTQLSTARVLDLSGNYDLSWDKATELLHKLLPETAGDVKLAGTVKHDFTVEGSTYEPEKSPVFKELQSVLAAGWDSAEFMGLKMGRASLKPTLQQGVFEIPESAIPADGGGTVRLAGKVDFRGDTPRYVLPGKLHMWEKVPLNEELSRKLITRIQPFLGKVASISGTVDLQLEGVDVPLSEAIFKTGAGRGIFSFSDLKVTPRGVFGTVLKLAGGSETNQLTMKDIRVNFEIVEGGIRYDDFTLDFGPRAVSFSGMVRFDDRLSMTANIPLGKELVKLAGANPDNQTLMNALKDVKISVPVGGTRTSPTLELGKVDLMGIIRKAAPAMILDLLRPKDKPADGTDGGAADDGKRPGAGDILKDILGPKDKPDDKPKDPPSANGETSSNDGRTEEKPKRTEDMIVDILKGVLKRQLENDR